MSNTVSFEISIPPDNEGYILLQCQYCGSFFKCTAKDLNDDEILNIHCPSCGLISDSYLTEDVIELAHAKSENYVMDLIYDSFKGLERSSSNKCVKFKAGKKQKHKTESPIRYSIDELTEKRYLCCNRCAKIKPLLKMSGSHCPFCGVISYADE